jgi:NAD(P)-dependent dehydrogenase (short-subunit alcohol dehydrogenase family)
VAGENVLIVGGTSGLGRALAEAFAAQGHPVTITGRDSGRAESVAAEIDGEVRGLGLDLANPDGLAGCLEPVERADYVVLAAVDRDANSVKEYDIEGARNLTTLKVIGFTEVLHCLHPRMHDDSAVLMYGGLARDRPYPGSTTVTAVNGAVTAMVRGFALELAPVRVNAMHPGIVGDSPMWENADEMLKNVKARTPTGRLVTMEQVTDAAMFLLRNRAMNGINLSVDGGWMML